MEKKFVDEEGIRTRYLGGGKGENPVLVHGGHYDMNCRVNDWYTIFQGFMESFHVIALDE